MGMVTIRDVARHAGVSVATVSRVINKSGTVSDDLSQRVQHAISALGFEPDFLARTWRTRVTRTVAAVISDNTAPHHGIVLREAANVALAHDYNLILCTTFHDSETEHRYLRMLRRRRVDGVLLNSVGDCRSDVRALSEAGVPVVLLNRPLADYGPLVDAVLVDSYRGTFDAISHLVGLGHRRIAMVYSRLHDFLKHERLRGYRDALHAHNIPYDERLVYCSDQPHETAVLIMSQILTLSPRPSAIYAASYDCALTMMGLLQAEGLRIPDDIAFVMFDDVAWAQFINPPLTLVQNPAQELGRVAMELLFARLADRQRPPQEIYLQPELVVRRSCGSSRQDARRGLYPARAERTVSRVATKE